MVKPRLTTSTDVFRRQGNPWVSRKEGIKDYGRNPDTENPEYDFDHRFDHTGETFGKPTVAPVKAETIDPRPEKRYLATIEEKQQKLLYKMRQSMARHSK